VLRAHGHTPTWGARPNYQGLSDDSQEAFRAINLRWHDLRHEYASRLVEHGVPLAQVRDLLGHASITTTERYDNQTVANLQIAAARLERGQTFAPRVVKVSRFFQDRPVATRSRTQLARPSDEGKTLQEMHLSGWLGRRDSVPLATSETSRGVTPVPCGYSGRLPQLLRPSCLTLSVARPQGRAPGAIPGPASGLVMQ
jgi:hypothetical protein